MLMVPVRSWIKEEGNSNHLHRDTASLYIVQTFPYQLPTDWQERRRIHVSSQTHDTQAQIHVLSRLLTYAAKKPWNLLLRISHFSVFIHFPSLFLPFAPPLPRRNPNRKHDGNKKAGFMDERKIIHHSVLLSKYM